MYHFDPASSVIRADDSADLDDYINRQRSVTQINASMTADI
jgi:hypothetical protein